MSVYLGAHPTFFEILPCVCGRKRESGPINREVQKPPCAQMFAMIR